MLNQKGKTVVNYDDYSFWGIWKRQKNVTKEEDEIFDVSPEMVIKEH